MSNTASGRSGSNSEPGGLGARFVERAASAEFDLIVVGGGITGCWATLLAARRGLKVCLVEAGDFGSGTSRTSHRILHGGFRYLQSMDLPRLRESVVERRHYFRAFPELVTTLPCLMPLYGNGLKRPSAFRAAALAYAGLAASQNSGVHRSLRLPRGGVYSAQETSSLFESVRTDGLLGTGLWHDGMMLSHARITMSILRQAAALGAIGLNHTPATGLLVASGRVQGVSVEHAGLAQELRAPRVLNTAGTWAGAWAPELVGATPPLVTPAMAFNLILDRPPVSTHGVAVEPPTPDENGEARTYFLVPRSGRIAAGTIHRPVDGQRGHADSHEPRVTGEMVQGMLDDLNAAIPGLGFTREDVIKVDAGLVPTSEPGESEPSDRPIVVDHAGVDSRAARVEGLVSAVTVKYTTARRTAARGLELVVGSAAAAQPVLKGPPPEIPLQLLLRAEPAADDLGEHAEQILALCEAEGVTSLADLVLGRTEWGEIPAHAEQFLEPLAELMGSRYAWDAARKRLEVESLAHALPGSLPKIGEQVTTSGEDSAL